ncbi:CRISPR-associated protein Csb1 [Sanguibacter gelidistatuariae]|uniref:CRISPR-associated protein Csb1 n=1 Tax=Sanguibacter gelidistatuariae TaxID=1814289 RepID=A0A1G6JQQ2_9MICO|nr:type I-U CRISPR-associated RAMP protein Csb1/Cas7u [Sanguibacter gelidistatuariae]SDC21023.1 CRISPR-associated protein Csb1 [Sanguibacter gelidistatuariae]
MTNTLKDTVRAHISDPSVSGLIGEVEYEPLGGRSAAVAPPTYAGDVADKKKALTHAYTQSAFVPARRGDGWLLDIAQYPDGAPRTAPRVVIDSVGSQSGRAETALWTEQSRLNVRLPGIVVSGTAAAESSDDPAVRRALDINVSSWELAHRHVDAWIRFATQDGTTQIWQQTATDAGSTDNLKAIITAASPENANLLFSHFPNACLYGFWLSSGVAARHRLARAYSSEITGFGAHAVAAGATKLDAAGGASNESGATVNDALQLTVEAKRTTKTKRPSEFGFGQVPNHPEDRAYVCELILQQTSLSLQVLRSLKYDSPEQATAATTVLTLLALAGHYLSSQDGFLRSGCSLVAVDERWGWRRRGSRTPGPLVISGLDEIVDALREALADAEATGLSFAAPVTVGLSDAEAGLITARVTTEITKTTIDEG